MHTWMQWKSYYLYTTKKLGNKKIYMYLMNNSDSIWIQEIFKPDYNSKFNLEENYITTLVISTFTWQFCLPPITRISAEITIFTSWHQPTVSSPDKKLRGIEDIILKLSVNTLPKLGHELEYAPIKKMIQILYEN